MVDEERTHLRTALETVNHALKDASADVRYAQIAINKGVLALQEEVQWLRNRERAHQVADSPQALAAAQREHDRLMAERAALREIAQWVADVPWYIDSEGYACAGCDKEAQHPATIKHLPDCPVVKARALLASEE